MTEANGINWLEVFQFHGLEIVNQGSHQVRATCPACHKPKLHLNSTTGAWDCKSCAPDGGSPYQLFQHIVDAGLAQTDPGDLATLADDRNLSPSTLESFRVCQNPWNGEWIVPSYNQKGTVINLFGYRSTGEKHRLMGSPGIRQSYFIQYDEETCSLTETNNPVWVLEGPWDVMAFHEILAVLGKSQHDYCGVLGANNIPKSLLLKLRDRKVITVFDNDKAGQGDKNDAHFSKSGVLRVRTLLAQHSIPVAGYWNYHWNGAPESADVRDMVAGRVPGIASHRDAWQSLTKGLRKLPLPSTPSGGLPVADCTSFQYLLDTISGKTGHVKKPLKMNQVLEDALAVGIATSVSVRLKGPAPVWVYIVGPSGSGKTTLMECITGNPELFSEQSSFTGLHSGWKGNTDDGEDSSPVMKWKNKTLYIKDYTTVLRAASTQKERINLEMRDGFEGKAVFTYRTGRVSKFSGLNMAVIACVTDEVKADNQTDVGERFLQIEVVPPVHLQDAEEFRHTSRRLVRQSVKNAIRQMEGTEHDPELSGLDLTEIRAHANGFLQYLHSMPKPRITISYHAEDRIISLAELVAVSRSTVRRGRDRTPLYRARQTYGTRTAAQLTRLGVALAMVFGVDTLDNNILRILAKVARDTAYGYQLDCIIYLGTHQEGGSIDELAHYLGMSTSHVRNVLQDLAQLMIVQRMEVRAGGAGRRGRGAHLYQLTPTAQAVFEAADITNLD